jgi:hypothetical protein
MSSHNGDESEEERGVDGKDEGGRREEEEEEEDTGFVIKGKKDVIHEHADIDPFVITDTRAEELVGDGKEEKVEKKKEAKKKNKKHYVNLGQRTPTVPYSVHTTSYNGSKSGKRKPTGGNGKSSHGTKRRNGRADSDGDDDGDGGDDYNGGGGGGGDGNGGIALLEYRDRQRFRSKRGRFDGNGSSSNSSSSSGADGLRIGDPIERMGFNEGGRWNNYDDDALGDGSRSFDSFDVDGDDNDDNNNDTEETDGDYFPVPLPGNDHIFTGLTAEQIAKEEKEMERDFRFCYLCFVSPQPKSTNGRITAHERLTTYINRYYHSLKRSTYAQGVQRIYVKYVMECIRPVERQRWWCLREIDEHFRTHVVSPPVVVHNGLRDMNLLIDGMTNNAVHLKSKKSKRTIYDLRVVKSLNSVHSMRLKYVMVASRLGPIIVT